MFRHHSRPHRRRQTTVRATRFPSRRKCFRSGLEFLEDRTVPTITIDLSKFAGNLYNDLNTLQGGINTALDAVSNVPFLNNQLGSKVTQAQVFSNTVLNDLKSVLGFTLTAADPAEMQQKLHDTIQSDLFNLLNPNGGSLPLLAAHDGKGGTPTASDVVVTVQPDFSFAVDMHLHLNVVQTVSNFNLALGLSGLPFKFESSGAVAITGGLDYELAFKGNPNDGSFQADTTQLLQGGAGAGHEMSLNLTVGLAKSPAFQAEAIVGFLEGQLTDHQNKTNLTFGFNLDNLDPANLKGVTADLSGTASLDLDVVGGFESNGKVSDQFPSIQTEFVLSWGFDTANPNDPITVPDVQFNNVQIDMGSFVKNLLANILQPIQTVTGPLEPIVKALQAPLPGISDLSHAIGQGDVSLESLAKDAAELQPGSEFARYVGLISQIVDIINSINNIALGGKQLWIDLGSFDVSGPADWYQQTALDPTDIKNLGKNLANLIANPTQAVDAVDAQLNKLSGDPVLGPLAKTAEGVLSSLTAPQNGIAMEFPIFESDPLHSAFQLLLGKDIEFVRFKATYDLQLSHELDFSFLGFDVTIAGNLDLNASLTLAYDTYGIRKFLTDGARTPGDLLDGLYIDNGPDPNSPDPNNPLSLTRLALTGAASASLGAGIPGVSITVGGGVFTGTDVNNPSPIVFTLRDPDNDGLGADNKVRADEILYDLNLGCAFKTQGELSASLFVEVKAGVDLGPPVGFVGYDHKFPFGSATLLDFTSGACNNASSNTPVLAGLDTSINKNGVAGQLDLFTGPYAKDRQNVDDMSMGHETFEVSHIGGTAGDETVGVTAFGYTQTIEHVSSILADGTGDDSDNFTIDAGVLSGARMIGGSGPDKVGDVLTYLGKGSADITGGPWDDRLTVGADSQPSIILSGGGNDLLIGGGDGDLLVGGGGPNDTDTFLAGPGNNQVLVGGQGTNAFYAGTGSCTMDGGPGSNFFNWQSGDGPITIDDQGNHNTLTVTAAEPGDTFVANPNGAGVSVQVSHGQKILGTVAAPDIQVLNMDDQGGNAEYTVNDLTGTGVQNVNVNLHEVGSPDGTANGVIENVATGSATITVDTATGDSGRQNQNNPPQDLFGQVTTTDVTKKVRQVGSNNGTLVTYRITAAVPNTTDRLTLNTHGGPDTITVHATQAGGVSTDPNQIPNQPGGQVTVNTYNGADTVNVGFHTLDDFFGPLNLFAQGGSTDQLTFDESQSYVNDFDRLSAAQLVRYLQPPTVQVPGNADRPPHNETAYPFVINFQAAGGNFNGVTFDTSHGDTALFIPETGLNEPVSVNTDGAPRPQTHVFAGYDGANLAHATTVEGVPISTPFPTTLAKSTLASLRSPLFVDGNASGLTHVQADDENALAAETYILGIRFLPPPPVGDLDRSGASPINYGPFIAFTLNAGRHGNQIAVRGVLSTTTATINAGLGSDTVTVGNLANSLDDIGGPLAIDGQSGSNPLTIHDDGTGSAQSYTLGAVTFVRAATQQRPQVAINFTHLSGLTFDASNNAGLNRITVNGTPATTPVTVHAGTGDALLEVDNLDALRGPLTFDWPSGNKTLTVNDRAAAAADTYRLTGTAAQTTLTRSGASPLTLNGFLDFLVLAAGLSHDNTIYVDSLGKNSSANVQAGKGSDSVFVADPTRNLNALQGNLTILGTGLTRLTFDDRNGPGGRDYKFDSAFLQASPTLPSIQFTFLNALTLDATHGAKVEVGSTAPGDNVLVKLQGGNNQVLVGSTNNTLATILGPVAVSGQTGLDPLVLNGQNDSGATYLIGTSAVALSGAAPVSFVNMGSVTLNGGGSAAYHVIGGPHTKFGINGLGGANVLLGPNQNNTWKITGLNAGTLDSSITFQGVQTLAGGSGDDAFVFQPAGFLSGIVSGGGGSNTLDYSALTTEVIIDMPLGEASRTGGIQDIQNVTGGSGDDILVGAGNGVLRGGAGRDILIASAGSARLIGGPGDDLLIGGVTAYDTNVLALQKILAEWASADTFQQRITFLTQGGGQNGAFVLTSQTVLDNGVPNILIGGSGHNWFFADLGAGQDTLTDFSSAKDKLTMI
jgi:hypothetical protein